MSVAPVGAPTQGVSNFELTISNPTSDPARLNLSVSDPSGLLQVAVPTPVNVAVGEVLRLPVEVRQLGAADSRERVLEFQIAAQREDGSRAGFANVTVVPMAGGRGGKRGGGAPLWLFAAGGLAAAAAIGVGVVALQGGDGESTQPTATPAVTAPATPGTTGTATTPGATQPPGTQPPTTAPTGVTAGSIKVLERWDYAFTIASNTCPFGASVGDRYAVSFRFEPATGSSTVINDGDRVRVTAVQDRDIDLGVFTFRFVDWEFTYPVVAAGGQRGIATLRTSFSDAETIGASSLTEDYSSPGCTITGTPFGN
jgi:hypothetical protein